MTADLESGALEQVARSYDVGEGAQTTVIDDGNISQVLVVGEMNRRSRAPFGSQDTKGLMVALLRNEHAVAGELQSFTMPYDPVNPANGYPSPIDPRAFDIWLLGASIRTGGGANVLWAMLGFDLPASIFSMSSLATGAAVPIIEQQQFLLGWTDFTSFPSVGGGAGATGGGVGTFADARPISIYQHMKMRLPTDSELTLQSEVTGAADVICMIQLGIFPAAVGQDAW